MEAWIKCTDTSSLVVGDIVKWIEADFAEPLARRGRGTKGKGIFLGKREVIAELLTKPDSKGFVRVLVRGCRAVSTQANAPSPPRIIPNATEIRRQEKTLFKNGLERRVWDDETARALVASRFMSNEPPPQKTPEKRERATSASNPSSRRRPTRRYMKKR